jgi:mannosylglycoprotein endo-beta-mannosidase
MTLSITSWTICSSHHLASSSLHPNHVPLGKDGLYTTSYIPPSQWDTDVYEKYCFLHRDTKEVPTTSSTTFAPGTALFQHWLAAHQSRNTTTQSWDPFNDFPTRETMEQYPDISDDEFVLEDGTPISAREYYTLWYTSKVTLPTRAELRSRGHLTLHGVNYLPIVYLDGVQIQPYSTIASDGVETTEDAGGMFLRRHYDIGVWNDREGGTTLPLEILVLPPPVVGKPTVNTNIGTHGINPISKRRSGQQFNLQLGRESEPQGQGGDHNLAQSGAIMQCTAGWDWIPPTPDRNTGIWDKVEIEWISGDVRLHDMFVKVLNVTAIDDELGQEYDEKATLPLGDGVLVSTWIALSLTATCHRVVDSIEGRVEYWIEPFENEYQSPNSNVVASGTIHNIKIQHSVADYDLGHINLPNVELWWPSSHGSQPLYSIKVAFHSYDENMEAQIQSTFGVRTISSYTHPQTKSFTLQVNGHSIFLVGGNWVTSDQFLRYSAFPRRYYNELKLLRNVGFNSVRVWGGGITETSAFYHAADALGILVYQEFWMTGDNNGRMAGSYDWPLDHDSYLTNTRDVIVRLRNHPSLAWYGGGNELYPIPSESSSLSSLTSPPKDIDDGLRSFITNLDGTRPYVSSSVTNPGDDFDPQRALGPRDGPYGILNEAQFFDRNPGLTAPVLSEEEVSSNVSPSDVSDVDSPGRNIGFQTEIGSVSHPELESLARFLSSNAIDSYPNCGVNDEHDASIHDEWSYFKYLPFAESNATASVDHICQFLYPPIVEDMIHHRMDSVEDWNWAAQLAQYFQYKALYEGYSHRMFEYYSALYLWKSSSPSPTLRGALYDWFLSTSGGYWGARAGLGGGSSVRIVLNLRDWTVRIVNASPLAVSATSVLWTAYSLDGTFVSSGHMAITHLIVGDSVTHLDDTLPWMGGDETSPILGEHNLQTVLIYRFEMSYSQTSSSRYNSGNYANAMNEYFLTDPSNSDNNHRQSRFALLGALRKLLPRINLQTICELSDDGDGVVCTILNPQEMHVAIMAKLSLVNNPHYAGEDSRILPTFFSDNYITLLPGESRNVNISHGGEGMVCSEGVVRMIKSTKLINVAIDGWNVQHSTFPVSCDEAVVVVQ